MFYENDRIVRKQQRWLRNRANEMIEDFSKKDLTTDETIAALELLMKEDSSGNKADVIKYALGILKKSKDDHDRKQTS